MASRPPLAGSWEGPGGLEATLQLPPMCYSVGLPPLSSQPGRSNGPFRLKKKRHSLPLCVQTRASPAHAGVL